MGKVYRKQMVEGIEVPGIIHNSNYFYVNIGVYEDGTVSCWHKSDLRQFGEDLNKGWVVSSIPKGQELSVHGLGGFVVKDARWQYHAESYYQHVKELVKMMNPEMANIYQTTEREIKKWDKARVSWSAFPTPYKLKQEIGYQLMDGETVSLFYRDPGGKLHLTGLTVYEDKTLRLEITGDRVYVPEEINAMFDSGTLCTAPKDSEWVSAAGIGDLLLGIGQYEGVSIQDKRMEVAELIKRTAKEEDAHDKCIAAYYQYLTEPSEWAKEELRKAYEAVPKHERMYLGDMDSRDSDFRRILYHPECKREV